MSAWMLVVEFGLAAALFLGGVLLGRLSTHDLPSGRPYLDVAADLLAEGDRRNRILVALLEARSARIALLERKVAS